MMKCIRLTGPGQISVEETEIPEISDSEILVKVMSAAICGTDIRMMRSGSARKDNGEPLILGHEVSGVIAKTGSRVRGFSEGMRVAVAPNMGCGVCRFCVSGNTHLCNEYKAFGINIDGGFAEYMRIPQEAVNQGNLIQISNNVSFDEAAVNEPFSCAYNGFTQYGVFPGDRVLIIGAGPIGLMHAKLAGMAGASKVMIHDLSEDRLEQCKNIDPSFITLGADGLKQRVLDETDNEGLDVCVTACPSPSAQADSFDMMGMGGRINFFGGLPKDKEIVPINTNMIHYKQLVVTGSTRSSISQFRKTLKFVSDGIVKVDDLVTGRFRIDEADAAFRKAANAEGIKTLFYFD
ncbi:MAG: alcohol dehydrogenase catalytic domain-containing protein [Eubacteriales bacterium]|nr:alcohol dehydrogenase catalytic domain-containing protein [Eubacteriales bacterium]